MELRRLSDLHLGLVGATGFEPVTPSVSGSHEGRSDLRWMPSVLGELG